MYEYPKGWCSPTHILQWQTATKRSTASYGPPLFVLDERKLQLIPGDVASGMNTAPSNQNGRITIERFTSIDCLPCHQWHASCKCGAAWPCYAVYFTCFVMLPTFSTPNTGSDYAPHHGRDIVQCNYISRGSNVSAN
jgi:hypothetical protein